MLKQWLYTTRQYNTSLTDYTTWSNPEFICRDGTSITIKANPLEKNLNHPSKNLENFYYLKANVIYNGPFSFMLYPYKSKDNVYLNVSLEVIESVIELHGGPYNE
jgi:hypothetical protein